ncbi:response regulator transcription factor [Vicingaceae bacterium]|nr:response regulator transcription factor [Vicingaceae bacterium]MDC1451227.1 response regulator transcription factor [Vicingaceae bacterium]
MHGNKVNLLFVEDDTNLGFVIKDHLEMAGYAVTWAQNGAKGLKMLLTHDFDIAILDVMLPKLNGFELAEELVQNKPDLPFLFLTAKSMLEDKVKGLKLGQDYITKPFEFQELELRIKNILDSKQYFKKEETQEVLFAIGQYEFDYINQFLSKGKTEQKLTKKEADLLRMLCLHKNEVMNRELALKSIWGNDDYFNGRSMDVFISRIRKYLKEDDNIQIINIHGVGFKLVMR